MTAPAMIHPKNKAQLLRFLHVGTRLLLSSVDRVTLGDEVIRELARGPLVREVVKTQTNAVAFAGEGFKPDQVFTAAHPVWLHYGAAGEFAFTEDGFTITDTDERTAADGRKMRAENVLRYTYVE